ncbi:FAD-dependent monooxygenase [Promicromonospora sp. NFX87]|uniref:FAD-dependent monooxygenase n=1 Tax=Promicromonospora sp. NFX87 TaxID=3402691 RepID=UPI003AFA8ADB
MHTSNVLIVGAGPTGLMLAIELARRGVVPRLIDASPSDHKESRAVAVAAKTLEALDDNGIAEDLIEQGIPLRTIKFNQGDSFLTEFDLTTVDSPYPMSLCLPQWRTVDLLRRRAEELGVTIEWNTRLTSCEPGEESVTAEIEAPDGRTARHQVGWLVGCDGAHGVVRRSTGIGVQTKDLDRGFVLGDVHTGWDLPRDRFHVYFSPTGVLALFPMPPVQDDLWRVLASTPDANPPRPPELKHFAEYVAERTPLDAAVSNLEWSSAFTAREGLADEYRSGRVLLAGDAAHHHSPIGGQGMNTGMQDAYNLGWKLALVARGQVAPALLDSYATERRPIARSVLDSTSTSTRVATARTFLSRRARRHALYLLGKLDAVQRRFASAIGDHEFSYRDSPLVSEHWDESLPTRWGGHDHTGPAAGELAPDAYAENGSGPVALRHLYRGLGHHLVLFAADVTDPTTLATWKADADAAMAGRGSAHLLTRVHVPPGAPRGALADPLGEAHRRYGVRRPSLYLIRPDNYVAYRRDSLDLEPVRDYFTHTLGLRG